MAFKKINIVILPEGAKQVRQLKVPKFLLLLIFCFFISGGFFLAWVFKDYRSVKTDIPRLTLLQKENSRNQEQIVSLTEKISVIQKKLTELNDFDKKLRMMVNLEPTRSNPHFVGMGGSDPASLRSRTAAEKLNQKIVRSMHKSLDEIDTEISVQMLERSELLSYLNKQKLLLASTPSVWPTRGWISSEFGYRLSPFTGEKEFHKGVDICNRSGSPVISPANGVVASMGTDSGYGNLLVVNHGYGLITKYAHLDKVLVKKGQAVERGQQIALVGNTGRTTGPHLHYEVHLNGVPVNPLHYILN
ncbi:MAG: M23 family metallopeptidase [Deltaproteobacteria bacterium]|nr:M23 family metallopeptidase [Deltaproteobacteria bacterium]